jgi:hypothetical protein
MSYDFATLKQCPHYIVDELKTLDTDSSNFVDPSREVASDKIVVKIDDLEIPKQGLYSFAEVNFSKPAPYRIEYNKSDMMMIKIGNGTTRTIKLSPGFERTSTEVANELQQSIPELDVLVVNDHVVLRSTSRAAGFVFSLPDPRWSDKAGTLLSTKRILAFYASVGVVPGKSGIGQEIYPSWVLTKNQNSFLQELIILFSKPIRNFLPNIKISYTTLSQFCGRCSGTRLEYDYTVSGRTYDVVRNTDLLIQEADKFLFTELGSHWKWPWLGSNILSRIGSKANVNGGDSSASITLDINQAFATYQNIKVQQLNNFPFQRVTDAETPSAIVDLSASPSESDPTIYLANVTIKSRSQGPIEVTRIVSIPDPFTLTTNGAAYIQNAPYGLRG